MKKVFLIIACISIFCDAVQAQDKSSVLIGGSNFDFIFSWKKRDYEPHWAGLGLAFNNFKTLPNGVDLTLGWGTYSFELNLCEYGVQLTDNLLVYTGFGMDFSRFRFKPAVSLQNVNNKTIFSPDLYHREYRFSKFYTNYFTFPLMLEFQVHNSNNKEFFIAAGAEALVNFYSKQKVEINTDRGVKKEQWGDFYTFPISYRLAARVGFENFSFFAYYQPLSIIQKNKGVELCPFGFGIALN